MGVVFRLTRLYNLARKVEKLIYYSTYPLLSQEKERYRGMENALADAGVLREMIKSSVDQCTDASLLDLVYKILVCSK